MNLDVEEIVSILKSILLDEMEVRCSADQIDGAAPLLGDGLGLDSVVIVELISSVEQRFSIEFQDADLRTSNFANLNALAEIIRLRRET
jgi:acyl carrier protein